MSLKRRVYNAIFTNERVVFEFVGNKSSLFILFLGIAFGLGIMSAERAVLSGKAYKMKETNPNIILRTHKRNFELSYNNIQGVLEKGKRGHIDITMNDGYKYKFSWIDKDEYKKLIDVLEVLE